MAYYLHQQQRMAIKQRAAGWLGRSELPTWGIIFCVYGGWFSVTACWQTLGPLLATPLLILLTTWYMSLQHELIHGHPTRRDGFNQLFGLLPLAVWFPWRLYRDSHLQHHRDEELTLPGFDPETYYYSQEQWRRWPRLFPLLAAVRNTLAGRVALGPLIDIVGTLKNGLHKIAAGDGAELRMWIGHLLMLAGVFWWLDLHGIAAFWYLAAVSYPALGLTKIRSFYEHRAEDNPAARSVLNEAGPLWRLLFLNLNYHLVHHDLPGLPWYELRRVWLADREAYRQRSENFVVNGYSAWFEAHLLSPVAVNVHPFSSSDRRANDCFTADVSLQAAAGGIAVAGVEDRHARAHAACQPELARSPAAALAAARSAAQPDLRLSADDRAAVGAGGGRFSLRRAGLRRRALS
ncbi:fatty acid desaturase [Erwinia oleae]|uniref:fatty acid desaturase n=1 Tax=Erwinia oleae TaxID=796334 RepID=UPI00090789DE|nr:fatty acid desaturase [Erwinia oleae]